MHPAIVPAAPLMEAWARSGWNLSLDVPAFVPVDAGARAQAARVLGAFASSASVIREVAVIDPASEWNIVVRANLGDQPFDVLRFLPLDYEATLTGPDGVKTLSFAGRIDGVLVRVCAVFPDRSPYPGIIRSLWVGTEDRDAAALAGHLRLKVAAERI